MNDIVTLSSTRQALEALPPEVKDAVWYDPRSMASRPEGVVSSYRNAMISEDRDQVGMSGAIGFIAGAGTSGASWIIMSANHVGLAVEAVSLTAIFASAFALAGGCFVKALAREGYDGRLKGIRDRIVELTSKCSDDDRLESLLAAKGLAERKDVTDPATLVKLDAVAFSLKASIDAAGPDQRMADHARDVAERAIVAIMAEAGTRSDHTASRQANLKLEQICSSVSKGSAMALAAPTARLSRILTLASRALADHPDMTDAGGARIDQLVRVHVPRLIALRAEALETARSQDIEAVDRGFDAAFDSVVASIEEAVGSIHDQTMDRLATEMRFLTARRGETPMLTAV